MEVGSIKCFCEGTKTSEFLQANCCDEVIKALNNISSKLLEQTEQLEPEMKDKGLSAEALNLGGFSPLFEMAYVADNHLNSAIDSIDEIKEIIQNDAQKHMIEERTKYYEEVKRHTIEKEKAKNDAYAHYSSISDDLVSQTAARIAYIAADVACTMHQNALKEAGNDLKSVGGSVKSTGSNLVIEKTATEIGAKTSELNEDDSNKNKKTVSFIASSLDSVNNTAVDSLKDGMDKAKKKIVIPEDTKTGTSVIDNYTNLNNMEEINNSTPHAVSTRDYDTSKTIGGNVSSEALAVGSQIAQYAWNNSVGPNSIGWCAGYVEAAINAVTGSSTKGDAKDLLTNGSLESAGYVRLDVDPASADYQPIPGDVVVCNQGNMPWGGYSEFGHAQLYSENGWVSDHTQNYLYLYDNGNAVFRYYGK